MSSVLTKKEITYLAQKETTTTRYPLHLNCNSHALNLLDIFLNLLNFMKFLSFIFFIIVICIIIENLEEDFNRRNYRI